MRFWRINSPEYESDYKDSYVNGSLEHPFGLPGANCDVCGETWGGSRILPFNCPESFHSHKNITNRWPIAPAEHEALQKSLMAVLPINGDPFVCLRPGDDFQPCFLDVPSRPRADFLWASLGSLIVDVDNSTRELRMTPEMWKGDKIFFLATTLYVVITDELRERLSRHRPTNVVLEEI